VIAFAALALSTATELDTLDRAVETCSRDVINPAFAAEAKRYSSFMGDVFREQESIVAARAEVANRRRALRTAPKPVARDADTEAGLSLLSADLDERQRALGDRRMLEALRNETMDAKRRYFLAHCAVPKDRN
jgi:hypothetical protein